MITTADYAMIEQTLTRCLALRFDDVSVRVGENIHFPGVNVVVTSSHFQSWLPEQRFHHVVREIPHKFYDRYLRAGVVWFELAPGETARQYMQGPRSEDVAAFEKQITDNLIRNGFQEKFDRRLVDEDETPSPDDFVVTRLVLDEIGLSKEEIEKVCLYLIGRGAYCDAHVLNDVLPELNRPRTR